MDKPDIATVIDSHFEEMTDLEQEIAHYFLQAETITDDLALLATENLFSNTNIRQKIKPTKSPSTVH